jgi:UV DNA damage endonuclease
MTKIIHGYACVSELNPTIKTGSTSTLTYINRQEESTRGPYLQTKAQANINNLRKLLLKNFENNLLAYRMPDDFMPMADLGYYDWKSLYSSQLADIGSLINAYDMHISFHPSQFFVLNSAQDHTVQSTIHNLNIFADILASFKLDYTPTLLLHVGALHSYRNWQEASDAFCANYQKLNDNAKKFLAVENDQTSHSIQSCLRIHEQIGIPVVFDNEHYKFNPTPNLSFDDALAASLATWKDRTPKVHLSSHKEGSTRHAHADWLLPQDYLQVYNIVSQSAHKEVIIMSEVKKKDAAVVKLLDDLKNL